MGSNTGSTVPRRQLGRYLRKLRNEAGLSVRAAASALEWSETKLWRVESGQSPMRALDAGVLCALYGASAEMTEALQGLARETRARGWWHSYGDSVPPGFDLFIGLEAAASRMDWYQIELIPGLFQTDEYAREVQRHYLPDAPDEEIERRVQVRLARQSILTRPDNPPELRVVLSEAAIRRPIRNRAAMSNQLRRLVEFSTMSTVDLRVVPLSAGLHLGSQTNPFIILRFPSQPGSGVTEPPTVYADGFTGDLYLDKSVEVARFDYAFQVIWETAASPEETRRLLGEVAAEYEA